MIYSILNLLRVKDWLKNIILFFPLIFSNQLLNTQIYNNLILAFILFSISASFIYVINDISDIESDKIHPKKKLKKPLANNEISIKFSYLLILILLILIIFLTIYMENLLAHVLAYIAINFIYNFFLKKFAVIDLIIISFGYVIRLDAGSTAILVESSPLMIITVYSLVFFILSLKRMGEFNLKKNIRESLNFYTQNIFIFLVSISSFSFLFFFTLFAFTKNNLLIPALPAIYFLLYRYFKVANIDNGGEFPIDLFFKDKILFSISILFIIYVIFIYL